MDFDVIPYNVWAGMTGWAIVVGIIAALGLLLGLLLSFSGNGANGGKAFVRGLTGFLQDIASISPKRVLAMVLLTMKEAMRRRALLVFVVFAMLLMFAGWFISNSEDRPELQVSVHITFVLTTISWLILPAIMFLSCWGIPEDIRLRSLHTVVTKPVRRIEIVIGRMMGFGSVAMVVLLIMSAVGYLWIQRQVPESIKDKLTCRVPVYGKLFFLDVNGVPQYAGVNVGDTWAFRSHIEGNTRARAVWYFNGVTPESVGDSLNLESRFEAFRTVKGSESTIDKGLEAQYTLVNDIREEAFASIGASLPFRELSELLRDGQFQNAADSLVTLAEKLRTTAEEFTLRDCQHVGIAFRNTAIMLNDMEEDFGDVADAFDAMSHAAEAISENSEPAAYANFGDSLDAAAVVMRQRGPELLEAMPRLEVSLDPFHVSEYHEGDDFQSFPRKITFAADYETTARFVAGVVSEWNEAGKLVQGDSLAPTLAADLADGTEISPLNADLLVEVLTDQITSGDLAIESGKLTVASGARWLGYFDQLVRQEKLVSQDPEGWQLEVDLFDDLTRNDNLRIDVACLNSQMYIGMARPDLFIRLPDRSFLVGYCKAVLNIALMLLLVVVVAVTASCIVKGPVSFFATLAIFIIGQFFHAFMAKIISGSEDTPGMVQSAILMIQHRNPKVGMDTNQATADWVNAIDWSFNGMIVTARQIVPDFSLFSEGAAYIENGFDVPWSASVLPCIATFIGFLIPCVLIGAACLKFRELESK